MSEYATQNIELAANDEEIERLKAQHEEILLKHAREQNIALESLEQALKEIERLKAANMSYSREVALSESEIGRLKNLLTRAADALERIEAAKHWQWTINLAAELRKAAE